MKRMESCPGCGGRDLSAPFVLPNQPVVLNYRFDSPALASNVPRRDITLVQCSRCQLIFNATFDPAVIPYDQNYENRQCFSPAFREHLDSLARDLVSRNHLEGGRVLEVGCGKGDFLRLICREARGMGTGYDTSYEGELSGTEDRISFHRQYLAASDVQERYDAVICRHVIEHVSEIGRFLRELRAIADAAGDPVVVLETPSFEWIQEQNTFWDIFYEHCNYFTRPCLADLARGSGFVISRQSAVFGGQYQLLELRRAQAPSMELRSPKSKPTADLAGFAGGFERSRQKLEGKLLQAGAERGWAIWGAGAKGVALVNQISILPPMFVIDANPAKHGCVIPGSKVAVVSPEHPEVMGIPVILVVNPNYFNEIQEALAAKGFRKTLLSA